MRRRYQSSITVFLCMMFLVFLLIITALFDFSRIIISRTQVQRSLNSTLLSVLANYSERLKSEYGLLYIDMDDLAIESDVFELLHSNLARVIDYDDVLNLYNYRINRNTMSINANNPLALREAELLMTQILEYSKYLVPLDLAINNYRGQINYRHLFSDVGEFEELADGFFYPLNVVEFLDKQFEMDRAVNAMLYHYFEFMNNIDGDVFREFRPDPDASYINRPLRDAEYSESWVSATTLEAYLVDAFEAGIDTADIVDTLDLYYQRLTDIRALIVDNHEHFDELFHNTDLIPDAIESVNNFEDFLNDHWSVDPENSSLEAHGFIDFTQYKIDYYKYAIDIITFLSGPEYDSLRSLFTTNYVAITQLEIQLNLVRNAVNIGNQPLAIELAQGYDQLFGSDYEEIMTNLSLTSLRNPIKDLYLRNFPDFPDFTDSVVSSNRETTLNRIEELVDDNIMHSFFASNLLTFFEKEVTSHPPGSIYNPLSKDSFDDVFLGLSFDYGGKSWLHEWKSAIATPNIWITDLINICNNHGTAEAANAREVFYIANFAYTIMHGTRNHIDSMDTAVDDYLEQFLISYYSMKTFRSFYTSSALEYADWFWPAHAEPMHVTKHKRNLERMDLHNMPHRALNYELEYIVFGAEDFNNLNPAGENDSAKYVGLLLFGERVAKNYAFMRTDPEARYAVNMVASALSASVPGLENRFTEVLEAVALFWAACESAIELNILRLGGNVYMNKPYYTNANNVGYRVFRLPLQRFMNNGLEFIMGNEAMWAIADARITANLPGNNISPHLPGTPVYTRPTRFGYDAHLMMLLTRVPNDVKIRRIQEVINHNMSATPTNLDYLYNTHAGVDVRVDVTLGMTFLNWDMFRASGIGAAFDGGFTHEVTWFQMY